MTDLFPNLPEQRQPDVLYTDAHALEPCARCGGSGQEERPNYKYYPMDMDWDPECRGCRGAGKRLRFVGRCSDD